MFKVIYLYTIFIMNFLLTKQLKCGNYNVENCLKCDTTKCGECKSGYFPTFAGLECTPCDDEENGGQKGCKGSCDSSKYSLTGGVLCDKCKDGYYSVEGICTQCSIGSPNCVQCSYEASPGSDQKIYTCLKCISEEYEISPIDGKCRPCAKPDHCLKCRFNPVTHKSECILCENGYYLSNGLCYKCGNQPKSVTGGSCYYYYCPGASNHDQFSYCTCNSNYALKPPNNCIPCDGNCNDCRYEQNTAKCYGCISYYTLSPQNTCTHCPSNCLSCYYDQNILKCSSCGVGFGISNGQCMSCGDQCISCEFSDNKAICKQCGGNYILTDKNICELLSIPDHCNSYQKKRFNNKAEVVCTGCSSYYVLDAVNNKCLDCPSYCTRCHFDNSKNFFCDNCAYNYVLNTNQLCEPCANNALIGGVGCIHCKYENNRNKCTQCRYDYIFIRTDDVCKLPSEINLNATCLEAIRLDNGEYSCVKCRNINYTLIIRFNSTTDCYPAENEIVNCANGNEDEYRNLTCTNCLYKYRFIWSNLYQKNICDDKCASDSFFNYDEDIRGCYKCDDESGGGQFGCDPNYMCSYVAADNHHYCNSCKPRYYLYDYQCLNCSKKDINCLECDYNITENKFKCNKCINNTFFINEEGFCQIITYDEFPEVTVGCILPINNYTKYIDTSKCFDCKNGFFKTREESCIYCKARKNGGPKCDECQYIKDANGIETNEINCKTCKSGNMLSPGRRCYRCEDEVGPGCAKCKFEDETEKVICEKCEEDYEQNNEGYCTRKYSYDKKVPNCLIYEDSISNSKRLLASVRSCKICHDGFYLDEGNCEEITLETCSFKHMTNFNKSIYDECKKFCEMNYYPIVDYKENNAKIEKILKKNLTITDNSIEKEIKDIIENGKLCESNIDDSNGLRKCIKIEYDLNTKKNKCLKCIEGYHLVDSNNRCVQKTEVEKNITKKECNSETIIIEAEKGTFCEEPKGDLRGCASIAKADTYYVNTIYNCLNCSNGFKPKFSFFFNRTICVKNTDKEITQAIELPEDAYSGIDKDPDIKDDGNCEIQDAFSPDGKNCYMCKNSQVGMPGCQGPCTYSNKREHIIECEGKCLSGYLDTSKGVCESCDIINKGCQKCNYTEYYPSGYSDFERQRRFECTKCDVGEGYKLTKNDGICHHCTEFGFTNCDKCLNNDNDELECTKCIDGYFLGNNGYCTKCKEPKVQGTENRCIFCNNTDEGGIDGCELCFSDNGDITCQQCEKGFILYEEDKTCKKIGKYPQIEKFTNCQKVSLNSNGDYDCTKCMENYNELYDKNREEKLCVNHDFLLTPKPETLKYCKKSINMGTEDQPKHSCEKCVENDILTQEQREQGTTFTKITFSENETSYCDISSNYGIMQNCSEARRVKNKDRNIIYNCTKCLEESQFLYKVNLDMKVCTYFFYSRYCMVKDCQTCKYGNNYYCSKCLFDNYEVNPATGSCIEKLPKAPAISWKDMFRLTLNDNTTLNSHNLTGYSVYLRGISYNQYHPGHAFLIDLIFEVLYVRNLRNIEESEIETKEMRIPTYCQIIDYTDEVKNKVNLIDYYCFANRTGEDEIRESDIRLKRIEISHDDNEANSEFIEFSNFEDMVSQLNISELIDKDSSSFTLKKFNNITVFEMDEVVDQKSENYTFDFIIYGRINKELEPDTIQAKFELRRIKNVLADCEFNIKENQTAVLKCHVNLDEHKEKEVFKFRTIEFQYKESSIFLNRFNEINLIHEEKEKKSNTLLIIIIVIIILLVIIITIFLIWFIRKISKKKPEFDFISKFGHKRSISNKKNKDNDNDKENDNYTTTNRPIKKTGNKRSIKNKKDDNIEIKVYKKNE